MSASQCFRTQDLGGRAPESREPKPVSPALSSGQLDPAGSPASPGARKPSGAPNPSCAAKKRTAPEQASRPAAMFLDAQGPACGSLKMIPLDGSSAPPMPTVGRHGRSPSALRVAKNANGLPEAANMAAWHA